MNDIIFMALGKTEQPVVLEASNKELLCPITSIHLVDTAKVLYMKMLLDWRKSNFKKKRKFKKKNRRGEKMNRGDAKMNIRGEKMISELPSCLKLKKCGGNSK